MELKKGFKEEKLMKRFKEEKLMKTIEMKFVVPEDFKVEDENEIRDTIKTLLRALVEDRGNYLLCRNGDDELVACLFAMRSKGRLRDIDLLSDYLEEAKSFLDVM